MIHSPQQRKMLWACLTDMAGQVSYHGHKMTKEDWKLVATASLSGEVRIVPSLDNDKLIMLGHSIKEMEMAPMADLITLIVKYGDSQNVRWSDPKIRSREIGR